MPEGQVLEFSGLTKRFGTVAAVSGFTARVEPGVVTGFLGPNGAGKTTTLRVLLGLVRADAGSATIGGVAYAKLDDPLRTVGAVLEASSFHPGRSGANHLKIYAQAAGLPVSRVDQVLETVGLTGAADRKVGGYSLGMRQRLGLAYALLGDPGVLVLDEPANGLDPEGIKWLRGLLRDLAREGRTVLVSSHILAEVQQTVDALLIIAHGRLVFQGPIEDLVDPSEYNTVVDSPDRAALVEALTDAEAPFEVLRSGLTVRGLDPAAVGVIAAASGVPLSTLQRRGPALEEVFLDLVNGVRVHGSATGATDAAPAAPANPAAEPGPSADPEPVAEPDPSADPGPVAEPAEASTPPADDPSTRSGTAATDPVAEPAEASTPPADDPSTRSRTAATDPVAEPAEASTTTPDDPSTRSGTAATPAAFAVAGTGVIDIVPSEPEPEPESPAPTFAVASTGLIDIVPAAEPPAAHEPEGDHR